MYDVNQHGLMTAATVAAVATTDTAAVICVHLFGQLADTCSIRALGWPVIDDCCQAAGIPVPPGTLAVLSFHATKCLTTGEGGLVAFDEASMIPRLRQNDDTDPRFSDLQAALGLVQIQRYPVMLARRHAIHSRYRETLASIGVAAVSSPAHLPPPFRFTVACPRGFEWTANAFAAHDVIVRRGVDALLHRSAGLSDEAYPGAVQRFAYTCSVPAHASLTDQEIDRVSQAMRLVLGAT
jgi:perosamine synthetase